METREIKLSIETATRWANGTEDIEIYSNY